MSQGQNKAFAIQMAIAALPGLIQDAEDAVGSGNGDAKAKIVTDGAALIVTGVSGVAAANNPTLAPLASSLAPGIASLFASWISKFITARKISGNPVTATPAPENAPAS